MSEVLESQYSLDEAEKINPNYSEKDGCLVIDEQEPQNISCQGTLLIFLLILLIKCIHCGRA